MASDPNAQFYTSEYIDTAWVRGVKLCIFDFDKTITLRHTQGSVAIHQKHKAEDEFIQNNFADLEFLKFVVPFIKAQQVEVGIASFGEFNEDAILSGKDLIRKYLDVAFGEKKSKDLFPDHMIAFWHPDSRNQDPKKIGKEDHISEILKSMPKGKSIKSSQIVLFDDDQNNIRIAKGKKHRTFFCEAIKAEEADDENWSPTNNPSGFHRGIWKTFIKQKGGDGGCIIL